MDVTCVSRDELEEIKSGQAELGDLRKLKSDIISREREQAEIIMNQSSRLEDLEKQYKNEQLGRKK